jgi:DNA polymerase I
MTPERCVIEIDWSMLELRLAAQVAQCSAMIEEFSRGLEADLHWKTASLIYGHPLEWKGLVDPVVQKRDRNKAKKVNFGLLYGLQPKNFQLNLRQENLFWSLEECKFAHKRFFESYPEMATMHKYWKDSLIKAYVDHTPFLEVRTLCGRRKLLNIKQRIKVGEIGKKIDRYGKMYHYAFANDIVNFPIQGTGADMAKKAMIEGQRLLNKYNLDCKFMLQLHDAFYLDCAVKDAKAVIELIGKIAMIDHVQHYFPDVPLSTSVEVGASMGNSQHYCDFIFQKVV